MMAVAQTHDREVKIQSEKQINESYLIESQVFVPDLIVFGI